MLFGQQPIGGLGTSHIPAIGKAVRQWLGAKKPDVVVMFYNNHGQNFFLDTVPAFAVGEVTCTWDTDPGWATQFSVHKKPKMLFN